MREHPFKSVTVETDRAGSYKIIASVEQASEFLVYAWPKEKDAAQLAARRACLDAMMGALSANEARSAFIEAAKQSGIYVMDGEWH